MNDTQTRVYYVVNR